MNKKIGIATTYLFLIILTTMGLVFNQVWLAGLMMFLMIIVAFFVVG